MGAVRDKAMEMREVASAAYRLTTDGRILQASAWQAALYERLSAQETDVGSLLLAPTGAGKTEAVIIPSLGLRRGGAPRRLFLVGPDGATLDDPVYRLIPYLRASVAADETPRTVFLDSEENDGSGTCRRFYPDGSEDPTVVFNPLAADVDLVLTTFARFRELFFGAGGVHALPSAIAPEDGGPVRRDLFFFAEAHRYATDAFARFHRLTEFLFAQDTDVIVASSTMPHAFQEELSFLEAMIVPATPGVPPRSLAYRPTADPLAAIETAVRRSYYQNARVCGVVESPAAAEALHARLAPSYPHSVYLYHPNQPSEPRRRTYAQLRELEKEGEGYLLLTTGDAIEASDLDAAVLLTTLCPPENLIRRAGRCNRRGDLPAAEVIVVGNAFAPGARPFNPAQFADYLEALRAGSGTVFDADFWKAFI